MSASATESSGSWSSYVSRFHDERPGITETILGRSRDADGLDPYQWVSRGDGSGGLHVDVGCGSGAMHALLDGWIGIDRSMPELRVAAARGRRPLVAAVADTLPLQTGSVDRVPAVMVVMVVDDPPSVLREIARVLRPDGTITMLLPATRPVTFGDRIRYACLLAALGRRAMPFPQREVLRRPLAALDGAGLEVTSDEYRRFTIAVVTNDDADALVESLYVPGVSSRRVRLARTVAHTWGSSAIGIPLRRIAARTRR